MKFRATTRFLSRLIALTLTVMTAASGVSWRCLDGTPCQAQCSMGAAHAASAAVTDSFCGSCPNANGGTVAYGTSISGPSVCVFSTDDRPQTSLLDRLTAPSECAAILPSTPIAAGSECSAGFSGIRVLTSSPPHLLTASRAPPLVS